MIHTEYLILKKCIWFTKSWNDWFNFFTKQFTPSVCEWDLNKFRSHRFSYLVLLKLFSTRWNNCEVLPPDFHISNFLVDNKLWRISHTDFPCMIWWLQTCKSHCLNVVPFFHTLKRRYAWLEQSVHPIKEGFRSFTECFIGIF